MISAAAPAPEKSPWKTILLAGFLAGSMDLIFAFIYYGKGSLNIQGVLQSIAGGLLGKATYQSGTTTALLGVVLHYLISCLWAAGYRAASRLQPLLVTHAAPCGLLFGALIYFFMNMVVLPLSAYHSKIWPPPLAWWVIAVHVFGVGLPIALVVRQFSKRV